MTEDQVREMARLALKLSGHLWNCDKLDARDEVVEYVKEALILAGQLRALALLEGRS